MKLNPDKVLVKWLRGQLKITKGQCPCVPSVNWNEDTICPCKEMREKNNCHCKLYVN